MYLIEELLRGVNVVLASASPRRKEILSYLNIEFEICSTGADEEVNLNDFHRIEDAIAEIAQRKLKAIRKSDVLVIAADTEVVIDNGITGKPANAEQAIQMLQRLAGRSHSVITAVALRFPDMHIETFTEKSEVFFDDISQKDIEYYIRVGNPYDKAGGYGIQEAFGALFIKKIDGCFFNVMGFPLGAFKRNLLLQKHHLRRVS